MNLFAIIIGLLIDLYYTETRALRYYGWFARLSGWVGDHVHENKLLDGPLGVLLVMAPVVAGVALVYALLIHVFLLLALIFAIVVLVYCLGPRRLNPEVEAYIDARVRDDLQAARSAAAELITGEPPNDAQALDKAVVQAVLTEINARVLAVLFWFFILGPVGAVLYRFSHELIKDPDREQGFGEGFKDAAQRLHGILAWVPSRLTAWAYALMGNFSQARYRWQMRAFDWADNWVAGNDGVLIASGTGALELPDAAEGETAEGGGAYTLDAVKDALRLVVRTTWLWLAIIILLALAG